MRLVSASSRSTCIRTRTQASEAALCANDQGKFWQLHDEMFKNQQQLAVENLKAKATELGLNAEQFNTCLDSGKYKQQVTTDLQAGSQAGVSGTPALFINGRFINGAVPYEQIAKVIDDAIAQGPETPRSSVPALVGRRAAATTAPISPCRRLLKTSSAARCTSGRPRGRLPERVAE